MKSLNTPKLVVSPKKKAYTFFTKIGKKNKKESKCGTISEASTTISKECINVKQWQENKKVE